MFQEALDKKLASWQNENESLTRESCTSLLKQLKKEHLDPVLAQLHGEGGARVMFEDIVAGYNRIEHDYKARATGAKDVCAAVFFEFHPVNEGFTSKMITDKNVNPPSRPHSQGNLSQIIIRSFVVPEIQGVSKNSQSFDADFVHVDRSNGLTDIFMLHENTHATRAVTELGTASKSTTIMIGITL